MGKKRKEDNEHFLTLNMKRARCGRKYTVNFWDARAVCVDQGGRTSLYKEELISRFYTWCWSISTSKCFGLVPRYHSPQDVEKQGTLIHCIDDFGITYFELSMTFDFITTENYYYDR